MRTLPCWALLGVLAACGADIAPAAAADPAATQAPPQPTPPVAAAGATVATATRSEPAPTSTPIPAHERAAAAVADLLAQAAAADAVTIGRAPATILALGDAALPGLVQGLASADVVQRRIAALTLLQWSQSSPAPDSAAVDALARARTDPDAAVRAAAEIAWRRATGDTTALDQSRAEHDAALRPVR